MTSKRIKTEPSLQEDQDDLLMSYLNSECMATSMPCWTNNNTIIDQKYTLHSDTVPISDNFKEPDHDWSYLSPSSPSSLMTDVSLLWAAQSHQDTHFYPDLTCSPSSYFQVTAPASPSSLSSCSSANELEKPRKKRGRKKRAIRSLSVTPPLQPYHPPVVIAPAPVKHQPILPARELEEAIKRENEMQIDSLEHVNEDSPAMKTTSLMDPQKAAIIAKRQERLIKNRAAALLSRKRKREHLIALEDQRKELLDTNKSLNEQIRQLQLENLKLQKRLREGQDTNTADSFICMMMAMILLFYCTYVASSQIKCKGDLTVSLENTDSMSVDKR
ncbi:Cyclic AMP-dependent transcription factor ATF-6 beta [Choanephora cucurbitarum]|uniref:Cyclic AMP-dependent transcription factor ATF-6 beta n=1 Tax=Choanephora cucurbitarum TaxID=101091 RepID=A0A1C7NAH3_9FUNG|nr:Cyclic AMP-dependent transcription factor ATF-6 beta [Choanephora cucurbitarum]